MSVRHESPRSLSLTPLSIAFAFAVAGFAWWRFSDNTADNDLWGHVLYGQRMLALGHLERVDPFSWTAGAAPWINHEVLAEIALGWTHRVAGPVGLWVFALVMSAATIACALWEAWREDRRPGSGFVVLGLFAVSTNGIALGFSVRPQLFTMLALVLLLAQMRRLAAERLWPLLTLPPMFLVWINTHGGVLAGLLLLVTAAAASAVPPGWLKRAAANRSSTIPRNFLGAFALCLVASLFTPWGAESLRWLVASVGYARPEITEWRPTPFTPAFATFWLVAALSVASWLLSRRDRRTWEGAILVVLLAMACKHQRHVPLFCLANLVLTAPHLFESLQRLREPSARLLDLFRRSSVRAGCTVLLLSATVAALIASGRPPRERPWEIEVERDQFPCAALGFLKAHPLDGNLLVFFDWGQQAMWELPRNRVSFDGRFDTVYPRALIDAHWKFYRGETIDRSVLDLNRADFALLPTTSGGATQLLSLGWTEIYVDPLATILVRQLSAQSSLRQLVLPIKAGLPAVKGREIFPRTPSSLAHPSPSRLRP
ncbi:MAG: hypothetical protein JWM32_2924 [Verrucomicrobia bacterium]|nr:hypothetical protein [Verrucomicrobiota bacterium]